MESIRVLLCLQPRILHESMKELLAHEPDIELVGETPDFAELAAMVEARQADVVICSLAHVDRLPEVVAPLIHPRSWHLAVGLAPGEAIALTAPDLTAGRHLPYESVPALLDAIRQAVRQLSPRLVDVSTANPVIP